MTLEERFKNPPAQFRQAPFWFWNHKLDQSLLDWQIEQMYEKGLGGFVMHARHGLITPYLSDEWMRLIRHCCEHAQERDMLAWAYDERDWPSGPAGGAMIEDPANRLHYMRLEIEHIEGPTEYSLGDDVVVAYLSKEHETFDCSAKGVQRVYEDTLSLKAGEYSILKMVSFESPPLLWFESYLDTLNPEACQKFIRSTYDFHEEKLGDLNTLGLAGFFTDEPAFSTYPDDYHRIPWTPTLPDIFQQKKGYDLLDHLPELFLPGESGAQVRYDYWDVASDMLEEAFYKPISEWCEKRNLQMIGHALGEEPLFYQFRCTGTLFKPLRHQHMPGLDHLTIQVGKDNPIGMIPKMVVSAALLAGRDRIMTETFGESGWRLSLQDMKWMVDWQMVHGVNYIIPHAFYYSIAGRRKKDSPPSEFYQAPHWPYYRTLADHTARVTSVMTGGEHVAKVALFYPMSSVWADFVPGEKIPRVIQEMEDAFAPLGQTLLELHRDFVIVDEESLQNASIDEYGFEINGLRFEALVLPRMTSMQAASLRMIRELAAQHCVVAVETETLRIINTDKPENVHLNTLTGVTLLPNADATALAEALAPVTPDVILRNAPEVYYLHRRKDDKDFYFFANTGSEAVETEFSLQTVGEATIWNTETGETTPLPGQYEADARLHAPLHLPPAGSLLLEVNPDSPAYPFEETPFKLEQRIKLESDRWHFTPFNGNFLALRNWHFTTETRHKVTELRYTTDFVLTEHIANLRLVLDGVPKQPCGVADAVLPMVGDETLSEILLDGVPQTEERPWEIDPHFRVVDLPDQEPGRHRLEIVIRNQGWFPQPGLEEYIWLAGDFMLDVNAGIPNLCPIRGIKTGPWEPQGYPNFSGTAAYAADVDLPESIAGKRVLLNAGKVGNLLEVEINGHVAGIRAWEPYTLDITRFVWPGQSNLLILKVTNTMRNLLEGADKDYPSGLLEDVWIEIG